MYEVLKKYKIFIFCIFIFSFLMNASFFFFFLSRNNNYVVCTDSAEYNNVAQNITLGKGIIKSDGDYNFRRLPGYPIFLATMYSLFGTDSKKALWAQIIVSSFISVLIFLLSFVFFPAHVIVAKLSAIVASIYLGFIFHAGILLSDSLFLLFFLLFCLFFFSHFTYKNIVIAGFFLGIASLIRPVGLYCLLLSIIILFFSRNAIFSKIKGIILFFVSWLSIVFWWLLRNYLLTGFIFFHTLPGIHFLIYSASYVDMDVNKTSYYESKKKLMSQWDKSIRVQEKKLGEKLNDIESCHIAEKIAFGYIIKHPVLFLKHSIIHMAKTCFWPNSLSLIFLDSGRDSGYYRAVTLSQKIKRVLFPNVSHVSLVFLIYLELFLLFFMVFGFFGFCVNALFFKKKLLYILVKIVPFIFLFIGITLAYGAARLRLAIEPFFIIFSACFWLELVKKYVKKGKWNV